LIGDVVLRGRREMGLVMRVVLAAASLLASLAAGRAADDSGMIEFLLQNSRPLNAPRLFQPPGPRFLTPAPAEPLRRIRRDEWQKEEGERGGNGEADARIGGGAICVRLCDGFYFPVPSGSLETRETVCRALCPDAETALYRGNAVASAVSETGQSYGSLKTAFLYRSERVTACTCRSDPADRAKYLSAFNDPTLKQGDTVVTATGALVFTSKSGLPYKARDFVSYQASALLPKQMRARIADLLGMSRESLLARAVPPLSGGMSNGAGEEDIPEITVTRRAPSVRAVDPVRGEARVVLPGPWVAQ
jgi:hypothetical protein